MSAVVRALRAPALARQGVVRVLALGLPLLVIAGVRTLAPPELQTHFFAQLTDVVLLVAVAKLGVDVYLPGCSVTASSALVSVFWKRGWLAVLGTLGIAALALRVAGSLWQVPLAAALVLSALLQAEIGRLHGRFVQFYFLKAPSTYLIVLAILLLSGHGLASDLMLTLVVLGIALWLSGQLGTEDGRADFTSVFLASIVSFCFVTFSWKEAMASRYLFDGESLAAVVMFSRLTMLVTFPLMLHNARVPIVMREHAVPRGAAAMRLAVWSGRRTNIGWSLVTAVAVVVYARLFEPAHVVGAALLMLAACVLVAFGNIAAGLVYLRAYRVLLASHAGAFAVFLTACVTLDGTLQDRFSLVALAAVLAQLALGAMLWVALSRRRWEETDASSADIAR